MVSRSIEPGSTRTKSRKPARCRAAGKTDSARSGTSTVPAGHADSRRRRRPRGDRRGGRGDRGRRSEDRLGSADWPAPPRSNALALRCPTSLLDSLKAHRGRAQGSARDAGRRGLSLDQRLPAQDLRPVCQPASDAQLQAGVHTPFRNVDLVVVRENTEDLYSGIEHQVAPGVVESVKVITARASTRIARFAFEYARMNHRTSGHRDSQGQHHEALRRAVSQVRARVARDVSRRSSYKEQIVDAACMRLVTDPSSFDVLLLENLYGDIVSDLCAGWSADWAWCRARTMATRARFSRRFTAPRRISPARASPTRSRRFCRAR